MAGGGARRGTLVIHYVTGHRRPASRPRQPRDGTGSCGSQPAHQSLLDRRLQRRPLPCATFSQLLAAELIGRRTLMPHALETGHESGSSADRWYPRHLGASLPATAVGFTLPATSIREQHEQGDHEAG